MESVIVFNGDVSAYNCHIDPFELHNLKLSCGVIKGVRPSFDRVSTHKDHVLVETMAFSLNFRDKGILLSRLADPVSKLSSEEVSYFHTGSDLVARIIDFGQDVDHFEIGDRVIPNCFYPSDHEASSGVPTNEASKRYHIFHKLKVVKIPISFPTDVAACFSVGAQTAYGMIRRVAPKEQDHIIVTAGKSNTSLFVLNKLKHLSCKKYVLTTSDNVDFSEFGITEVFRVLAKKGSFFESPSQFKKIADTIGGFDAVIDPFSDVYATHLLDYLRYGAKYITCGLYFQHDQYGEPIKWLPGQFLMSLIIKNIHFMGNCLGSTQDLQQAISDYEKGQFSVTIDSTFGLSNKKDFFERSFNFQERFGKTVMIYS